MPPPWLVLSTIWLCNLERLATSKLDLELWMCPQPLSIPEEQPRIRAQPQSNKCNQAVAPTEAQRVVHLEAEQREYLQRTDQLHCDPFVLKGLRTAPKVDRRTVFAAMAEAA